jgi:cation diffusion facilitator CzcD-associated flavoprotein CzcO
MLSWLIIGGGVHGTLLSHHMTAAGAARDRLRVLDPYAESLHRWNRWTAATGMDYLRSPAEHQLDVSPMALLRWAASGGRAVAKLAVPPLRRPSLTTFRAHWEDVAARHRLDELRIAGTARALRSIDGGVRVETDRGALEARRVVLAVGQPERLHEPSWARRLRGAGVRVEHVLDLAFRRAALAAGQSVAVVGGGLSAVQLALTLADGAPGRVTLISRRAPRVSALDATPEWFEDAQLATLAPLSDLRARRAMIASEQRRGSVPRDIADRLAIASRDGTVMWRQGEVLRAAPQAAGGARLELDGDRGAVSVDRVVLATGFARVRPGGEWLDRAIAELGLPTAPCGYPVIDAFLRWHPGIYVSGGLAELQLGPAARSIAGARRAARVLAVSL